MSLEETHKFLELLRSVQGKTSLTFALPDPPNQFDVWWSTQGHKYKSPKKAARAAWNQLLKEIG